jgi:hypothetical protein
MTLNHATSVASQEILAAKGMTGGSR